MPSLPRGQHVGLRRPPSCHGAEGAGHWSACVPAGVPRVSLPSRGQLTVHTQPRDTMAVRESHHAPFTKWEAVGGSSHGRTRNLCGCRLVGHRRPALHAMVVWTVPYGCYGPWGTGAGPSSQTLRFLCRPPTTAWTAGCPPISSPIAASVMEPQCYVRATAPRVPFSLDVLASGTQSRVPRPESAPKGRPSFSSVPCLPWCGRVWWGRMRPGGPGRRGKSCPAQPWGGTWAPPCVTPQLWGRVPLKLLKMRQKETFVLSEPLIFGRLW